MTYCHYNRQGTTARSFFFQRVGAIDKKSPALRPGHQTLINDKSGRLKDMGQLDGNTIGDTVEVIIGSLVTAPVRCFGPMDLIVQG